MNIFLKVYVFILYKFSDILYLLFYYVIKYRKKVVYNNLKNSFPNYSHKQIKDIQKKYFLNFTDWIVEYFIINFITKQNISKFIYGDIALFKKTHSENKNFYGFMGHQFNWEFLNLYVSSAGIYEKCCVFYLPLSNKIIDKIIIKKRIKFGVTLINAYKFAKEFIKLKKIIHIMGILADQRPFNINKAYWCDFLNQKTSFIKEAEKSVIILNSVPVFIEIIKIKRGLYKINLEELKFNKDIEGDLTKQYAKKLEMSIIKNPDNYLWSHKKWKNKFISNLHNFIE